MSPDIRWIYQGTVVQFRPVSEGVAALRRMCTTCTRPGHTHAFWTGRCFLSFESEGLLNDTARFFAEKAEVSQLFLFICVPDVGFCPETAGVEYLVCVELIGWFLLVEASGFRWLMVWGDFAGGGITGFGVLCDDPEGWLDCWTQLILSFSRPDFCLLTVWTQKVNKKSLVWQFFLKSWPFYRSVQTYTHTQI